MARAKTVRTNGNTLNKQVLQMPELTALAVNPAAFDLESEIRRRAYELYEQRGCTPGQENEDWLVAEREIKARRSQTRSA